MPEWMEYLLKMSWEGKSSLGSIFLAAIGITWKVASHLYEKRIEEADRGRDLAHQQRDIAKSEQHDLKEQLERVLTQTTVQRIARPKPTVNLECRGFFEKVADVPFAEQQRISRVSLTCQTIAFRNHGSSVNHLTASLDFLGDNDQLIAVNTAWWLEDADATMSLYIGSAETRHLVVTLSDEQQICVTLNKELDRNWRRYLPSEVPTLNPGRWRLKVELTADSFKQRYYSVGHVHPNGTSSWSSPNTEEPSDWNRGS